MVRLTKRGRKTETTDTRTRILDAAERLFAQAGFKSVPLRRITEQANADLGLISYYFGSKENLYAEAMRRRSGELTAERLNRLNNARQLSPTATPDVDAIVGAYLSPVAEWATGNRRGWRDYLRMAAQASNDPNFNKLVSERLDPAARHFISALRAALPGADLKDIHWSYQFMISLVVHTLQETGRIDLLSDGLCRSADLKGAFERLQPFVVSGMLRVARARDVAEAPPKKTRP